MKHIALFMFLFLTGCETDTVLTPEPIDMPVSVTCKVKPVAEPIWASTGVTAISPLFVQAQACLATNEQRKGYESELVAANKACQ